MRRSRTVRPAGAMAGLAATALLVGGLGVARGDDVVSITQAPTLSGAPEVGQQLTATGAAWFPAGAKPHWHWLRCQDATLGSCKRIKGARSEGYVIAAADQGARLRVSLTVTSGRKQPAAAVTEPSEPVAGGAISTPVPPPAASPSPTPAPAPKPKPDPKPTPTVEPKPQATPTAAPQPKPKPQATPTPKPKSKPKPQATPTPKPAPTPKPKSKPQPAPTPTGGASPVPVPASTPAPPGTPFNAVAPAPAPARGGVKHASARNRPMLHPFPRVRIQGVLTVNGARVTRLLVKAPRRARIRVRCGGPGCPVNRWSGHGPRARVVPLQRALRRGTRIVVLVTRRGYIGKRTEFVIRRGRAPLRRDQCVRGNGRRTVACRR